MLENLLAEKEDLRPLTSTPTPMIMVVRHFANRGQGISSNLEQDKKTKENILRTQRVKSSCADQ